MTDKELAHIDDVAMTKAMARFGSTADLSMMQRTVIDTGQDYATYHYLGDHYTTDPEVAVNCVELAQTRRTQMVLALQKERDLERIAMEENITYEEALFRVTKRKTHAHVNKELERLDKLATARTEHLLKLANTYGRLPTAVEDAIGDKIASELKRHGLEEPVQD